MINLDEIRGYSVLSVLEKYDGKNPYIKKLRNEYIKNKKINLTPAQTNYILDNHKKEPLLLNRVIAITPFLGEELKNKYSLTFTPQKILVEYLLADTEKTFHIYGKLKKNQQESGMYFIPKTQILDDLYFEKVDVEVDFEKYEKLDRFVNRDGTIGRKIKNHQKEGIKFLLSRNGAILGDGCGMGKTYQAIVAALEKGAESILIVCPSCAKINWSREIGYFQCYDTSIIEGNKYKKAKFTIINYDILKNFHTVGDGKKKDIYDTVVEFNRELVNSNFDLVIIDESHNLKDPKSLRGSIMIDLCVKHKIKTVWLLTGTPVCNRPSDYYALLRLIKAPIADNWKFFMQRYCDARRIFKTLKNGKKKQIWLQNGASNLEELGLKTKNHFLRRLNTELEDMPDKVETIMYHKLDKESTNEYNDLWEKYLLKRKQEKKRGSIDKDLVEVILLRKFIAMQAIPKTIELVENTLEEGKKVIIFTNFTDELNEIAEHFGNICVTHNGKMNDKDKQNSIDEFQNNPKVKIFIGNIRSAGVAITLTQATVTVFNSYDWVPANNEQAVHRNYRIGQTELVNVYYQLFEDTISVRMWETLERKKDIIATIMGEKEFDELEIMEKMMDVMLEEKN